MDSRRILGFVTVAILVLFCCHESQGADSAKIQAAKNASHNVELPAPNNGRSRTLNTQIHLKPRILDFQNARERVSTLLQNVHQKDCLNKSAGLHQDPNGASCGAFYMCTASGLWFNMECPNGLSFHAGKQDCVDASKDPVPCNITEHSNSNDLTSQRARGRNPVDATNNGILHAETAGLPITNHRHPGASGGIANNQVALAINAAAAGHHSDRRPSPQSATANTDANAAAAIGQQPVGNHLGRVPGATGVIANPAVAANAVSPSGNLIVIHSDRKPARRDRPVELEINGALAHDNASDSQNLTVHGRHPGSNLPLAQESGRGGHRSNPNFSLSPEGHENAVINLHGNQLGHHRGDNLVPVAQTDLKDNSTNADHEVHKNAETIPLKKDDHDNITHIEGATSIQKENGNAANSSHKEESVSGHSDNGTKDSHADITSKSTADLASDQKALHLDDNSTIKSAGESTTIKNIILDISHASVSGSEEHKNATESAAR